LGLPLFLSEVSLLSPLSFGVPSFFIGGLSFEPMSEGCGNAPLIMALAYLAEQLLSNAELAVIAILTVAIRFFWGRKLMLLLRGYMGPALLKTSHPRGLPL
jgi:hypothetical protein